jgi:DNA-binding protein WhiA
LRTDPQEQDSGVTASAGGSSRQAAGGTRSLTEEDRKKLVDTFGMNMWEETGGVSPGLIRSEKCARAYLMDTFLCVGSVSDPGKDYHLEFNCRSLAHAKQILALLYMLGKSAGFTERKSRFIVYLKDSQDIIDLLGLMGAHISMMDMENQRIRKDVVNTVNRRVNCDTANAKRTVGAAQQQIRDIRFLEERGILKVLPEKLREMAELRTDYPELPLGELGQMLQPPVSKSGVNHRLKKLSEIAEKERSADHKPQPAGGGE